MAIWVIADLHLSFGVLGKEMDIFGPRWVNHPKRVAEHWKHLIAPEDLVLIPGDISWARTVEEALPDLLWIDALPGTKLLLKGNHDYWWSSKKKVIESLPSSLHIIQNDTFDWQDVAIGGARLWDFDLDLDACVEDVSMEDIERSSQQALSEADNARIFQRELGRLSLSLKQLNPSASLRIAMTHYPPVDPSLASNEVTKILEENRIDLCVFGHLHSAIPGSMELGTARGVRYVFTACDYLDCKPVRVG